MATSNFEPVFSVMDPDFTRSNQMIEKLDAFGHAAKFENASDLERLFGQKGRMDAFFIASQTQGLFEICQFLRSKYPQSEIYVLADKTKPNGSMPGDALHQLLSIGVRDVVDCSFDAGKLLGLPARRSIPEPARPTSHSFFSQPQQTHADPFTVPTPPVAPAPSKKTNVYLIGSGMGGEGKSTFSSQFSMKLARQGEQTLLIDSNKSGNAAALAALPTFVHTINDFEKTQDIRSDAMENMLLTHEHTGLRILPSKLNSYKLVTADMVVNAVNTFKDRFQNIVIDLEQGFTPIVDAMLKLPESHPEITVKMILLAIPDKSRYARSLEMALKCMDRFPHLTGKEVCIVLNKVHDKQQIESFRYAIRDQKFPVYALPLSDDFDDFTTKPPYFANPTSFYAKSFQEFLEQVIGVVEQTAEVEEDERQPGFFRRIFSKRR